MNEETKDSARTPGRAAVMATLMLVAIFAVISAASLAYAGPAFRLWIESWHFGIRDAEMRADALRDNTAWRRLVAEVVRRGIELGTFGSKYDPDKIAVLTIAAVDGMGIPLSLADPQITPASAAQDVMAALRDMLRPAR